MIRLTIPSIEEDDLQAVREALASGYLVQGPRVQKFESQVAAIVGVPHAVAVSNGTAALHLALLALGVRPGDFVAVTAYSWPATANVIELCGAQPVFVDIDRKTFNMDPDCLRAALRRVAENRETMSRMKAVLPIDAFGQMADLTAICSIAAEYELPVVEDAACALGAKLNGKPAGSWTALGTFSFHPRKAITTGEGGMITTSNEEYAWKMRVLRNHGQDPRASSPDFVLPGFNYRMTDVQAALGITQLNKMERMIRKRLELARNYDRLFTGTPIATPFVPTGNDPVFQSYVCLLPRELAPHRQEIIASLKQQGIETAIGTWHMPMCTYFRTRYGFQTGDFPATDEVFARSVALPLFETLSADDQQTVAEAVVSHCRTKAAAL